MRRLLLFGICLLPIVAFGFANDALAGQTDGINGEGGRPFTTTLAGANEVPSAPTSDLTGTAKVTINLGQSELCWDLDYTTTQTVTAAHIHKGGPGVANPPIFPFFGGGNVVNSGCRAGDPALLADIAAHPGNYYVNVHTTANPAGAGRGQLTK
ncbi:MAG: CHRD domain-containing protein [Chloroflexi bacterium]|nr:MAG: CHRD domain-containing protein [Chloroflexota bacterium]